MPSHLKKIILTGLAILGLAAVAFAQNKTLVLDGLSSENTNYIFGEDLDLLPGDTLAIPAGRYGGLRFYDIHGLPGLPITIINQGGLVEVMEGQSSAVEFQGSSHIQLTGSGDPGIEYGIEIRSLNPNSMGINITNLTTDVEIDHIEVAEAGFAGIMVKTDPDCDRPETWRDSFVLRNLYIHHNKIHHTGGEGIYVGYTGNSIYSTNKSCSGDPVYGHWLEDVEISHNIVRNTGFDGIQLNLARTGGVIRSNTITNYGRKDLNFQNFALSIGAGEYSIYNNTIVNTQGGYGQGIQLLSATAGTRIFNNVISHPRHHGIFVHSRAPLAQGDWGYVIANNTIIKPEKTGIFYNARITEFKDPGDENRRQNEIDVHIVNNLVVDPGYDYAGGPTWKQDRESYIDFNDKSTRDAMIGLIQTNLLTRDLDILELANPAEHNYAPGSFRSLLVDTGTDLKGFGIAYDIAYRERPSAGAFDIGAFEYRIRTLVNGSASRTPLEEEEDEEGGAIYPNPTVSSVTLEHNHYATARIDVYSDTGARLRTVANYALGEPIDVSGFKEGTYYLQAHYSTDKSSTYRLVVGQ